MAGVAVLAREKEKWVFDQDGAGTCSAKGVMSWMVNGRGWAYAVALLLTTVWPPVLFIQPTKTLEPIILLPMPNAAQPEAAECTVKMWRLPVESGPPYTQRVLGSQ